MSVCSWRANRCRMEEGDRIGVGGVRYRPEYRYHGAHPDVSQLQAAMAPRCRAFHGSFARASLAICKGLTEFPTRWLC